MVARFEYLTLLLVALAVTASQGQTLQKVCSNPSTFEAATAPVTINFSSTETYALCYWLITAPTGKFVEAVVTGMSLVSQTASGNGFTFLDGTEFINIGNELTGELSDYTAAELTRRSRGNSLYVKHDASVGNIEVQFNLVDEQGLDTCSANAVELSGTGTINFPPANYNSLLLRRDCTWVIRSPCGQPVQVTINKTFSCGNHLKVYYQDSASGQPDQTLCDDEVEDLEGMVITSTSSVMTLQFQSLSNYYRNVDIDVTYDDLC